MPEAKFMHVVSSTSQDAKHPADNLISGEPLKKWKGLPGEAQISAVLKLEKASQIQAVDIGNEFSAFVELLVGRSGEDEKNFQVLLPSSSFMNPNESRSGTNGNRVRMFGDDMLTAAVLPHKWDVVKVVCTQPFNKQLACGLSFLRMSEKSADSQQQQLKTGITPKRQETSLGRFTLRDFDSENTTNASKSQEIPTGSLFQKRHEIDQAKKEDQLATTSGGGSSSSGSGSGMKIKNGPPPKPSTPSTFQALAAKRKRSVSPEKKRGDSAINATESLAAAADATAKPPLTKTRSKDTSSATGSIPSASSSQPKKAKKSVPFDELLSGVTIVLSGYQNPKRGELREKAMEMGAKYQGDWRPGCTHLVCAFANTPKFNQVKGRGKIVKHTWVEECHRMRKRLPWRRYALDRADQGKSESEDEVDAVDDAKGTVGAANSSFAAPATGGSLAEKRSHRATVAKVDYTEESTDHQSNGKEEGPAFEPAKLDATLDLDAADDDDDVLSETEEELDTDEEVERIQAGRPKQKKRKRAAKSQEKADTNGQEERVTNQAHEAAKKSPTKGSPTKLAVDDAGLPVLPDFFKEHHFLLFGTISANERKQVIRYISAFGGTLEQYMGPKVTHVLTNDGWVDDFDQPFEDNPKLLFVKPEWIIECGTQVKISDITNYLISKP